MRRLKNQSQNVNSILIVIAFAIFATGNVQFVLAQSTQPFAIYATSAKSIRIVPLVKDDIPDLDKCVELTASATCQTDLAAPPHIYSLSSGDFIAVWWNAAEDTACYSRFTPDGKGSFTEDYKGGWHGGATSHSNRWSPLPPADLNADQKDDLVLVRDFYPSGSTSKSAEYKVAFGKDDGTFDFSGIATTFVTGAWTIYNTLADVDGDAYPDIVYHSFRHGGSQSTVLYMLKGKGDGTFSDVAQELLTTESNRSSNSAAIADFNSDGYPDIFLPPDDDVVDEGQAHIAFGQGNGIFGPIQESIDFVPTDEGWSSDTFSAYARAYDLNMDGHIDIVAKESTWDIRTTESVWWGDGNGQFSATGEVLYSIPSGSPHPRIDWLSVPFSSATDVVLDMDPFTPEVESETYVTSDYFWVAVVAQNVQDLDTYQVEVSYNPSELEFVMGVEDNPASEITNLLKQNGGTTVGFQAVERIPGTVNMANALSGKDCNEAPDGSGVLGLLKFRILDTDSDSDIQLILENVFFNDCNDNEKEITELSGGTVIITPCFRCDFNGDSFVDDLDLMPFTDHWLTECGDANWDAKYDLNEECIVNYKDLGIFADCWKPRIIPWWGEWDAAEGDVGDGAEVDVDGADVGYALHQ